MDIQTLALAKKYTKDSLLGAGAIKGQDGKTPVRGTDYWTEADKQQVVNEATSAVENGAVVSEISSNIQQLDSRLSEAIMEIHKSEELIFYITENTAFETAEDFDVLSIPSAWNGNYDPPQKSFTLTKGSYVVAMKYRFYDFTASLSTFGIRPYIKNGSESLYVGVFNSTNIINDSWTPNNQSRTIYGYINATSDGDYTMGFTIPSALNPSTSGKGFKFDLEGIALLKISNESYKNNSHIKLLETLQTYGFSKEYNTGIVYPMVNASTGNLAEMCEKTVNGYTSADGTSGLKTLFNRMFEGGKVILPVGKFNISESVELANNSAIEGECWGYSEDPNGVWGIKNGSRFELNAPFNAFVVNTGSTANYRNGIKISDVGIQGTVKNSNTQGIASYSSPDNSALAFLTGRADQCVFEHIDVCGMAIGILVKNGFNLDACTFDGINADGCNVGLMMLTGATYYTKFSNLIMSDCPAHGVIVDGIGTNLVFDRLVLVRNCGGITDAQKAVYEPCSAYFDKITNSIIRNCYINTAGQWVEYFTTGSPNMHYEPTACGVIFKASDCTFVENTMLDCQSYALKLDGSKNKFANNTYKSKKGCVINGNNNLFNGEWFGLGATKTTDIALTVEGDGNVFNGCMFDGKVIVNGNNNVIHGIGNANVTDNGTGNIID